MPDRTLLQIEDPTDQLVFLCRIFNRQSRPAVNRDTGLGRERFEKRYEAAPEFIMHTKGRIGIWMQRSLWNMAAAAVPFEPAHAFFQKQNDRTAISMSELHAAVLLTSGRAPVRVAEFLPDDMRHEKFRRLCEKKGLENLKTVIEAGMEMPPRTKASQADFNPN